MAPRQRSTHNWLRHVADEEAPAAGYLPEQVPWTAATLDAPPTFDGANVLDRPQVLHEWLYHMVMFGFARLTNTPADPTSLRRWRGRSAHSETPISASPGVFAPLQNRTRRPTLAQHRQHADLPLPKRRLVFSSFSIASRTPSPVAGGE
ncbi:MAG: hypothetical protein R2706_00530 [Acidimicrobiales bacterium]